MKILPSRPVLLLILYPVCNSTGWVVQAPLIASAGGKET